MVSDPLPDRCLGLCGDMLLVPFRGHMVWLLRLRRRVLFSVGDTGEVDWQGQVPVVVSVEGWSLVRRRPFFARPDERGK